MLRKIILVIFLGLSGLFYANMGAECFLNHHYAKFGCMVFMVLLMISGIVMAIKEDW